MRRTVLSALALAGTAVLAVSVPAYADDATPAPSDRPAATRPAATPVPVPAPTRAPARASEAPGRAPTPVPDRGQVSVVPEGAPDTGVVAEPSHAGPGGELIGAGAAAVLAAGGTTVLAVRRRRTTGA